MNLRSRTFGGKSRVATSVWKRLGNVENYIEPFFGSGSVLMMRPSIHKLRHETVNDIDAWLVNFWRSVREDPNAVAEHANWPVSELDLHARGDFIFHRKGVEKWVDKFRADPTYYNAKLAGWWVWGCCCRIGSWCPNPSGDKLSRSRPKVVRVGVVRYSMSKDRILHFIERISRRLRNVTILCGSWDRTCTSYSATTFQGVTGVFLDPPYGNEDRVETYAHDDFTVAADVRKWCLENGDNKMMRIALCGYEGEGHEELVKAGWAMKKWKATGGYGNQRKDGDNKNARRERIWFSPHCLNSKTGFGILTS